ncbi:PREDICTED: glucose dehydrogenase [FAD, quinone]-like [Polistes canadensis]|uniref:glucose dehydrogenase [FAD, quinone]-like n=1 Tax=Polistes canadensis TaxID=91411 RepID=UPI000718B638|nr:PREDICTED: glucose dehydrogenase [FAD, quinone]-like [Polistes canadensis]
MSLSSLGVDTPNCSQPFLGGLTMPDVCVTNHLALFLPLLSTLVTYHPKIGDPCGRVKPVKRPDINYDFIVVGAGAAGPVVAARLSENPDWKVLLIEAGDDEPAGAEIPSYLQAYLGTSMDWNYKTSDEPYACLANNRSCNWPRGKNMGGCTAHHGMAYHRGHAKDYERWVKMGSTGWSWNEVLPYFLMSEDNREIGRVSEKYHGTGGVMTVERFPWQPQFAWDILSAAKETKYGVSEDLVGEKITGFTVAQTLSKDGVRQSTAAAYLRPYRNKKNLHVLLNATVTTVLTRSKKAYAVKYVKNKITYTVKARREIILSGGAINSPKILLDSGIGPKDHLKSVKVPVVHDLPGVGENLHNHVSYGLDFNLGQPPKDELNVDSADLYLYNQTGPLSSTGLAQVTAIIPSQFTTEDDPDIQLFFAGFQATCTSKQVIADLQVTNNQQTIRMTSVNIQSRSRGYIRLRNNKPESLPYIRSNELEHFEDKAILVAGIRVIQAIANTTVMQKRQLKLIKQISEPCSKYEYDSDDYWMCEIQWNTRPENHQAGSCKMGPRSDPMAVVDPKLKVHGIEGLRVADASIMPQVVSGNPVAAINMIGERCADFIKKKYLD